jgi:hypothetical protein
MIHGTALGSPMSSMPGPQHERMAEPSQAFPCPRCKVPVVATAVSGSSAKCHACGATVHFKNLTAEGRVGGHLFRRARHPGAKANYDMQLEDGSSFHRRSLRWHRLTREFRGHNTKPGFDSVLCPRNSNPETVEVLSL